MYTIKEAAARAGLGVPLLRAWERRYGIVNPARSAARYRLYDDVAIDRLRQMRRLVDDGWPPSEAARAVRDGNAPPPPADEAALSDNRDRQAAVLVERFVAAAADLDAPAVEAALDEILSRGSFEAVVDESLLPAAAALGDAWAAGQLDVAGEHAASAAVLRRLAAAFQAAGRSDTRPVIVGLPPGSRHELGALAFAVALRRRGTDVLYLGPDVPVASWVEAATRVHAPLAVIGVVTDEDGPWATAVADALGRALPGLLVAFGGAAAPMEHARAAFLRLPPRIGDAVDVALDALRRDGASP